MNGTAGEPGDRSAGPGRPRWHGPAGVTLVVGAAVAGYMWSIDGCRHEYARHQVWQEARKIEDALRSGTGYRNWLFVEKGDSAARDAEEHGRHEAILRDFERLAHLEGLVFSDLQVAAGATEAVASFRVDGRARDGNGPAPARGELVFRRTATGWQLAASRLFPRDDARSRHWKGAAP